MLDKNKIKVIINRYIKYGLILAGLLLGWFIFRRQRRQTLLQTLKKPMSMEPKPPGSLNASSDSDGGAGGLPPLRDGFNHADKWLRRCRH